MDKQVYLDKSFWNNRFTWTDTVWTHSFTETNRFARIDITWTNSTITDVDKDLWERALTSLEELHAVVNDKEAGTEETGLDTVKEDNGGESKLFNLAYCNYRNSSDFAKKVGFREIS